MVGDIVGFTAHMAIDERQALDYIGRMRGTAKPLVAGFDGLWVKDIGDGFLASFHSAVEAVGCAVAIQRALYGNPDFQLRLGIHLGDVVFEDDDVLGDGVNIAARLETLAVPGGICASGQIVDLVRNQPDLHFARLGVTNLPHQVAAYAVGPPDLPLPTVAETLAGREADAADKIDLVDAAVTLERDALRRRLRRWQLASAVLLLLAVLGAGVRVRIGRLLGSTRDAAAASLLVVDAGHDPQRTDDAATPAGTGGGDIDPPVLRVGDLSTAGDDDVRLSARFNDVLRRTLTERNDVALVPDAAVRALVARLRMPADAALTPAIAVRAAARDPQVRAVVAGDVRFLGGRYALSVDLVDPTSGATIGAWSDDAAGAADLLPAMRRLADAFADAVPDAVAALPTPMPAVAPMAGLDVTTSSAAALAAYADAFADVRDGRWDAAHERAEQAVAADPGFALAHVVVAEAERRLGRAAAADALGRALALTGTLPAVERDLVRGAVLRGAGDCPGAADALQAAARTVPALAAVHADLDLTNAGLALACAGNTAAAVQALEAAVAARPGDAAPAGALLRVHLAKTGDIAAARRAARVLARAIPSESDPAGIVFPAIELAANARLAAADDALASAGARAGDDAVLRIRLAFQRAAVAAAAGDIAGAAERTRQAADLAERHAATQWQAAALWQLGWLDRLRGDEGGWSRRLADLAASFPPSVAATARAWQLADRARAGDGAAPAVFARDVASTLPDARDRAAFGAYIDGQLALARGDVAAADSAFAAAAAAAPEPPVEPPTFGLRPNVARLALAEAAAAVGGSDVDALATVQSVRDDSLAAFADPLAVGAVTWLQSHARAGRLLESAGDRDAAVAAYETLLRWWGDSALADAAAVRVRVGALTGDVR